VKRVSVASWFLLLPGRRIGRLCCAGKRLDRNVYVTGTDPGSRPIERRALTSVSN